MHIIGQMYFLKVVKRSGLGLVVFLAPVDAQFDGWFEKGGQGIKFQ
jgi:hypothetical protein